MSLTINNLSSLSSVQFKGHLDKTASGNNYYKNNTGLKVGLVASTIAGLDSVSQSLPFDAKMEIPSYVKTISKVFPEEERAKFIEEVLHSEIRTREHYKKHKLPFFLLATGLTLGSGLLVDYVSNQRARKNADFIKIAGNKQAVNSELKLGLSDNKNLYVVQGTGKRLGPILGALCGIAHASMAKNARAEAIMTTILFAAGGWLLGKFTDSYANKKMQKNL